MTAVNIAKDPLRIPEQGELAEVRRRRWLVSAVESYHPEGDRYREQHAVTLESIEEDANGEQITVIWQIEPGARILEKAGLPEIKGHDENGCLDAFLNAVRWGIATKVSFDYPFPVAKDFPDVLEIIEKRVKPEREHHPEKLARERWWCFQRPRPELFHSLGRGLTYAKHPEWWREDDARDSFIGTTLTSKNRFFVFLPNDAIIDQTIVAICDKRQFAILSSNIHIEWANKQGGTLGAGLRYTPSDCYETFPFSIDNSQSLDALGERYDAYRRKIMTSRQIGLTALYNLFHDPSETDAELEEMRRLQREIDVAVRDSYGWQDIDLDHGFHEVGYLPANDNVRYTISEPARIEILKRLAALNRQRWEEEEAAGLHKKGKK